MERHSSPGAACGKSYMSGMLLPEGKENSGTGAGCFAADKPALYYPGAYWLFHLRRKMLLLYRRSVLLYSGTSSPVHGFRELVDSVLSVRVSALARAESNQPPFYDASVGGVRVGDMVGKRGDASFVLGRYAALGLLPVRRDFQCRHCHPWRHAQRLCAENRTGGAIWRGIRRDFHHLQSGCCHDLCCADPSLSVIDSRGGVPDYAASFPKTSLIMLGILAVCFFLTFSSR